VDGIPETRGGPDRPFLAGAAATFFLLLLAAELGSRWAVGSGALYRRFDFSGTLTSLPELRNRIAWTASRPRPVFVLGDSVLGATALWEHRIARPRRQTVPEYLAGDAQADGWSVTSLAADGLLLTDLAAIGREVEAAAPSRVLVVLNVRMFAPEFGEPAKALSRDFLRPALAEAVSGSGTAAGADSLAERLSAAAAERSYLMRTTRQLQPLWYFPTRRDAFRRLLEPARAADESSDIDLEEAALHLKVDPYYRSRWAPSSLAFRALGALLDEVRGRDRVVVVLSPQNPEFVADPETFAWNRRILEAFVASRRDPSLVYRDFGDRYPSDRFLDHCHLTPQGNREYAEALLQSLRS
jgi:hypothetical protein